MSTNQSMEYWGKSFPWSFKNESVSYRKKRELRYNLQDYMHDAISFQNYRSKTVLEIGSGGGIDSAEFAANGAEVVSVDFTHAGVRTTRDTLKEAGAIPNVVRASAQSLPFRPESFDCAYSYGVLHHIPDVERALDEISGLLKPGGDLICMLYNKDSLLYAYSILFLHREEGLGEKELVGMYSERNLGCPYTRAYTKDEAIELLSKNFESIEARVYFNVIDTPVTRKVKFQIPDKCELGWHIIVKGKRRNGDSKLPKYHDEKVDVQS